MSQIKIPDWKRAVIKVGSSLIAPGGKGCSSQYTPEAASLSGDYTAPNIYNCS